jgi:hypothetical protein
MQNWFGLSGEQLTSIGSAIGVLLAGMAAGFFGYRSKRSARRVTHIPLAALPTELTEDIEEIKNRAEHIERKVDVLEDKVDSIYTDTQVLRDRRRSR